MHCRTAFLGLLMTVGLILAGLPAHGDARISWIVEATTGTVTLQPAADEFADPRPIVRTPATLSQGDRIFLLAGASAEIFDGRERMTLSVEPDGKAISREAPPAPPEGSVLERIMVSASQRRGHSIGLEHISRPGLVPSAEISKPAKDGILLGELPTSVVVRLRGYSDKPVKLRLSILKTPLATSGEVMAEVTLSSRDGMQRNRWEFPGDKREKVERATHFFIELLVDGKAKDVRRLSRIDDDVSSKFKVDEAQLATELGLDDAEKLQAEPSYEYLLDIYGIVGPEKVTNMTIPE